VSFWIVVLAMAAVTLGLRASFLVLPAHATLPPAWGRALRHVPPAVLTALWAPELLLHSGSLHLAPDNERLWAGIAAAAVAWVYKRTGLTLLVGFSALHLADAIF